MSEDAFQYVQNQARYGTVSEYIRGLIHRERQRREDLASRPVAPMRTANDAFASAAALEQLERIKAILEKRETYDD